MKKRIKKIDETKNHVNEKLAEDYRLAMKAAEQDTQANYCDNDDDY